jgi:hypothetical protein
MAKIANVALTNTFDTWRVRSNEAFDRLSQFAIDNSKLYANTLTANVSFVSRGNAVFAGSTSNTLVRITQTGSGNALVVEDSANPDATPFVVTASGDVGIGTSLPTTGLTIVRDGSTQFNFVRNSGDTAPPYFASLKRRGTEASKVIVNNGDQSLAIQAFGYDGSTDRPLAEIAVFVDGVPGSGDMPGRLVFSTTADGASTPTERMRIDNAGDVGIGTTNPTARLNVVDATSQDAVRITQTGTGNALVVEDAANPDSTPFVVDSSGRVLVGTQSAVGSHSVGLNGNFQVVGATVTGQYSSNLNGPVFEYNKSRSSTIGSQTIVQAGDQLGLTWYGGSDGTAFIPAALIQVNVDGTPGTNDMPGRITFSTTADGASTPTERMRISANGNVGIGTSSPGEELHVNSSGAEFAIQWDSTGSKSWVLGSASNRAYIRNKTDSVEAITILNAGNVGIGTNSPAATLDVVGTVSVAKANILSQTLTDGATINWNTASGQVATVTLGGSRIMAAPTNLKVGTYILHVIQDGTGSKTLTWNSVFKWTAGVAPPLTTTANARDIFSFVSDGTNLYGSFLPDVR